MTVRYSQQSQKLDEYLEANGFTDRFNVLQGALSEQQFDRIFDEHFSKRPYREILMDFVQMGCNVDTFSAPLVQMIQASPKGRGILLRMAQIHGRESFVSNELIKSIDDTRTGSRSPISLDLLSDLESRRSTPFHEMYFPLWPDAALFAFNFRKSMGYRFTEMLPHMGLMPFFAIAPSLGEEGPAISEQGRGLLTFPNGFKQLSQNDLRTSFLFQCDHLGEGEAIHLWLPMANAVDLSFVGLTPLASHLGIDNPVSFVEEMMLFDDKISRALLTLVARMTIGEIGVEALSGLSKKSVDFLVGERVLSNEQALFHPNGGDRYAAPALEEGLGL
jgi:hypothetical protein